VLQCSDVRFGALADIVRRSAHVRFTLKSVRNIAACSLSAKERRHRSGDLASTKCYPVYKIGRITWANISNRGAVAWHGLQRL